MEGTPSFVVKRIENTDAQRAYCCMTEVPTPWPKALCQCRDWVSENLGKFVDGYHLQLDGGDVIGHIYFAISERALFTYEVEPGVGVLYCEWIQQRYQKQGLGKRLFDRFLAEMQEKNCKGILIETTDIEGQMHYRHYVSRGFNIIDEVGNHKLLYMPLSERDVSFNRRKVRPQKGKYPVEILLFRGFHCPYEVSTQILVRDIALEFGPQVSIKEIWTTPESLETYGIASGVLINGNLKLAGGETELAIRQAIREEL